MAFGRIVNLVVKTPAQKTETQWTWTETTISALDMEFNISRSRVFNDNTAEFTVYNPSEDTQNKILQRGAQVEFSAGYEDQMVGILFMGTIVSAVPEKSGPDTLMKISAVSLRSIESPFQITPINLSYGKNTPMKTVLEAVGASIGVVVEGLPNVTFSLPNGWTYAGNVRGALRYCVEILKSNGLDLFQDISALVIYKHGEASNFDAIYLSPESGLLGDKDITDMTDVVNETLQVLVGEGVETDVQQTLIGNIATVPKRIELTSLLIPKARPNGIVQVSGTDSNDGIYITDVVVFKGDNMGIDFSCTMEVIEP